MTKEEREKKIAGNPRIKRISRLFVADIWRADRIRRIIVSNFFHCFVFFSSIPQGVDGFFVGFSEIFSR